MWEQYQRLARSTRETVAPILSIPLIAGVATDFWSHPNDNNHTEFWSHLLAGSRADIARRTILASIPEIGPVIADHIGNFGYSAAMIIPITTLGVAVKEYGSSQDNKTIEIIGEIMPILGFLGIIAVNLAAESISPDHSQLIGDLIFGMSGAILAHYTTKGTMERTITKWKSSADQQNYVLS